MKKITSFFVILMMLVSFFSFTGYKEVKAEESNYIYISADGNDETGDGSESNPLKTLEKAVEACRKSDANTILLKDTYSLSGEVNIPMDINIAITKNFSKDTVFKVTGDTYIKSINITGIANKKVTIFRGTYNEVLTITNGNISENIAYNIIDIVKTLNINNVSVLNNKCNYYSSLFHAQNIVLNGGSFKNNYGAYPSTSLFQGSNSIIVNNCEISGNDLGYIFYGYSSIAFNNGHIYENYCRNSVVFLYGSFFQEKGTLGKKSRILTINGGVFENNTVLGAIIALGPVKTGSNSNVYVKAGVVELDNLQTELYVDGNVQILNNVSKGPSAGIYIGPGGYAEIRKAKIMGNKNEMTGNMSPFSGGGVYNDGYTKFFNTAIVNNTSTITEKVPDEFGDSYYTYTVKGGGIGTCPTSNNYIYLNEGVFLYGNTNPDGPSDIAITTSYNRHLLGGKVYTDNPMFYISSHFSNTHSANFYERNVETLEEMPFRETGTAINLAPKTGNLWDDMNNKRDVTLFNNKQYSEEELNEILEQYDVIIMDNTSTRAGGGIGSNGTLVFGNKDEAVSQINISASCHECIAEQPEEINVTLYDKNDDKIRDITLLKSEDYTASVPGLADIQGYYVEQESLGEDFSVSLKTTTSPLVDGENGIKVRNINFELRNECITETQGTTAKLKKYMVVDKNAEIPSSRFEFSIAAGQGNDPDTNSAVVYPGVEPEDVMINGVSQTGHVNFNAGESTVAGPLTGVANKNQKYAVKDITLDFRNVTFTEPGVYRYILTENSNSNSAINNDTQPVRVIDVHIIWNDDSTKLIVGGYVGYSGNVTASPKLLPDFSYDYEDTDEDGTISQEEKDAQAEAYQEAYDAFIASIQDGSGKESGSYVNAGEPIGVEAGEKSDKYVNNLETYSLTLGKKVAGGQASRDEYFKFNVTIENAGSKTLMLLDMSNAEQSTHANNSTSYSVSEMNLKNNRDDNENIPGNQIQANDSGTASFTVYLHHGQSIKLDGIPKNATYTITEDESPGYTIKSTNASGTIESDVEALFVNERGGIVPTGIFLSVLPALVVSGVLIVVFVLRGKSKKDEEE